MLESTFQLAAGVGARREARLWRDGIVAWRDLAGAVLPRSLDGKLRAAVERAASAYAARDADRLGALVPSRAHWRLFAAFADDAGYLDIETSDDAVGFAGISAIGLCDRDGPRLLLAGRDLAAFPDAVAGWKLLVTFNGRSFDVPLLRRAFPDWRPPACHVDLRHALARLGHAGGLKAIERRLGLRRPPHLDGIDGWDAAWLYRRGRDGDRAALRTFAEYNLYDVIDLRTLMAYAYNALVVEETAAAPAVRAAAKVLEVPGRGDVLYDVSKILLGLT